MAKNEDLDPADQGVPAADIPDLKAKDKERKKAGAAWSGVKPGGSFSGATGGAARAAASAASSVVGAGGAAGAGWFSVLTATLLGKALVAFGVLAMLAGVGLVVGGMSGKGGGAAAGKGGPSDLGAIASSMKVRSGGSDRVGFSSKGEIAFDPAKPAEAKKPEAAPEEKTAGDAADAAATADAAGQGGPVDGGGNRPGLEHNLSGSKLSSSLGGGFGGKNIFSGNSNAPKFGDGGGTGIKGAMQGKLSAATRRAATGKVSSKARGGQMKSNRAMAQLLKTKGTSLAGASISSAEGARSTAGTAFDGGLSGGGDVGGMAPGAPGGAGAGAGTGASNPGGGATDVTTDVPEVEDPCVVNPAGCPSGDPIGDAAMAAMMANAQKAKEMRDQGFALIIAGFVCWTAGICLLWWPATPIGVVLMALAVILIAVGIVISDMGDDLADDAFQMADDEYARTGNKDQYVRNKYCIQKSLDEGISADECEPTAQEIADMKAQLIANEMAADLAREKAKRDREN